MSPRTPGAIAPIWRIERFELIFYNARHRRWQYFIEGPASKRSSAAAPPSAGSVHRQQIPRFLTTFRRVVTHAIASDPRIELAGLDRQTDAKRVVVTRPLFEGWETGKTAYLNYILYAARSEGLDRRLLNELSALTAALATDETRGIHVTRAVARALLSLLPIKEDWDTWGCFARARQTDKPSLLPPTRFGTRWFQPFYLAEFKYHARQKHSTADSVRLLGQEVELEAACRDLSRPGSALAFATTNDFFHYCYTPKTDDSDDNEFFLYRCYGHFVDTLVQALTTQAPPNGRGRGTNQRRYFVIAYPVQVAGRLHFAQIALTTTNAKVNVGTLWDDWARVHDTLWVPECVSLLESALERASLSAFQFAVDDGLRDFPIDQLTSAIPLKTALASHIYHVLPIRSLTVDGKQWRYVKYHWRTLQSPINAVLGRLWQQSDKPLAKRPTDVVFRIPSERITGRLAAFGDHRLHGTMIRDHAVHVIEQQLAYFSKSMKDRIDEEERDRHRAESILRRYIENLSSDALSALADGHSDLLNEAIDVSVLGVDEPFRCPSRFATGSAALVRRYLAQVYPDWPEDRQFEAFQQMASPRPPELATRLLDSSLVKIATHSGVRIKDYFDGDTLTARYEVSPDGFLGRTYATLYARLVEWNARDDAAALKEAWDAFVVAVQTHDVATLARRPEVNAIVKLREERWGPYIQPDMTGWQHVQRIPWEWLRTWLPAYKKHALGHKRGELQDLPVLGNSEAELVGTLPSPHVGKRLVKLKERGIWLPYKITQRPSFEDGSDLLDAWFSQGCSRWAHLGLVYPATAVTPIRIAIARADGKTPWEWLSSSSPLWPVFQNPVNADPDMKPYAPDSESLVIVLRTWVAP